MVLLSGLTYTTEGMWRVNKEEIGKWLDMKEHDFSIYKKKNPWIISKK
jgi:hypothetical protein